MCYLFNWLVFQYWSFFLPSIFVSVLAIATTPLLPVPICANPRYLVSGPDPIPDGQLTASTWEWDQLNNGDHGPSQARLNMTRVTYRNGPIVGYYAGVWVVDANIGLNTDQWIQVAPYVYFTFICYLISLQSTHCDTPNCKLYCVPNYLTQSHLLQDLLLNCDMDNIYDLNHK